MKNHGIVWAIVFVVIGSMEVPTATAQSSCYELAASISLHYGRTHALATYGNRVFVLGDDGLYTFRVEGTTPTYVGRNLERDYSFGRMAVSSDGRHVYVAADSLFIYDVSANDPVLRRRKEIENAGKAADVKVSGNLLVVANPLAMGGGYPGGGVNIYSLTDPENPALLNIARNTINDKCSGFNIVEIQGNYLYAFAGDQGCGNPRLWVWTISNPSAPQCIGYTTDNLTNSPPRDLRAVGNWVFLLQGNGELTSCNVATKSTPVWGRHGSVNDEATGMAIIGTNAYIAKTGGIRVLDISDPASGIPLLHDPAYNVGNPGFSAITLSGSNLVAGTPNSLSLFNSALEKVGGNDLFLGNARRVIANSSTAFVLDGAGGIKFVDIREASVPRLIAQDVTTASAYCYALSGNGRTLCVGEYANRFQIYDVSNPELPVKKGGINLQLEQLRTGGPMDVTPCFITVKGSYVIVGVVSYCCEKFHQGGQYGIVVINISDPNNPVVEQSKFYPTDGIFTANPSWPNSFGDPSTFDLDPTGNYGFLPTNNHYWDNSTPGGVGSKEYQILRVDDSGRLTQVAGFGNTELGDNRPWTTVFRDTIAYLFTQSYGITNYVPNGTPGIYRVNTKSAETATIMGFEALPQQPLDAKVWRNDLLVALGDSVEVFDISATDGRPSPKCVFATVDYANGLWIGNDGTLFVADGNYFSVYRLTDNGPSRVMDVLPSATDMDLSCRDRDTFHIYVHDGGGKPVAGQQVGVEDELLGLSALPLTTDGAGMAAYPVFRNGKSAGSYTMRFLCPDCDDATPVNRTVRIDATPKCEYAVRITSDKVVYNLDDNVRFQVHVTRNGFPAGGVNVGVHDPLRRFCALTMTEAASGTATYTTHRTDDSTNGYISFGFIIADRGTVVDSLQYVIALDNLSRPLSDDPTVIAVAPLDSKNVYGSVGKQLPPITAGEALDVFKDAAFATVTNPFVLATFSGCLGGIVMMGTGIGAAVGAPLAAVSCPAMVDIAAGSFVMNSARGAANTLIDHTQESSETKESYHEIANSLFTITDALLLLKGVSEAPKSGKAIWQYKITGNRGQFSNRYAVEYISSLDAFNGLTEELGAGTSIVAERIDTMWINDTCSVMIITTSILDSAMSTDSSNYLHFSSLGLCYNPHRPTQGVCVAPVNSFKPLPMDSITFSWKSCKQATRYDMQVVSDTSILDRIEEKGGNELQNTIYNLYELGIEDTTFVLGGLKSNMLYYWRVRGVNDVYGLNGKWSDVFAFRTPDTTIGGIDGEGLLAGGDSFRMESNYKDRTSRLLYTATKARKVDVAIVNVYGDEVLEVAKSVQQEQGIHSYEFTMVGVPEGIYFCVVKSNGVCHVVKFISY